ncbi:hypothetical protein [Dyadobacter sp. CY343]|uniref:hypothetical protein n=1 Tax=Dyadobacter sp. CY343 TaxID=2907299 RepID=UPI001F2F92F9|nr:hypothetical protein [Dyadobacter sp. CY343]MCE7060812.1 hypothetical protein [Dyadobacter sp. CY343]
MLSGGVLIIGSLIWDRENGNRIRWRNDFLNQAGQIKVPAPIRYGRVSRGRCCTFSMVFSDECNRPELKGTGILVPFANNPVDLRMLRVHTSELMKAERNKVDLDENVFNWAWGALAMSVNPVILNEISPKYDEANNLAAFWRKSYTKGFNPEHYKVGNEECIISKEGILKFSWPDELDNYDFLIATATKPERIVYPTAKNIAERMLVNEYSEYFFQNSENGILNFQDDEILEIMNASNN